MVRKITSIVTLIVVAFALLPAVAAFAADGSASLSNSVRNVFPGAKTFDVTVQNAAATGGVLGSNIGASGSNVRFVSIDLPLNTNTATCGAVPANWTCKATNRSGRQPNILMSTSGAGIAPNGTLAVQFTANVNAPATVNRLERLDVYLSADGQQFDLASGDTSFTVHGLELVQGITINDLRGEVPPANVYPDTRYTTGQQFEARFNVINRSQAQMGIAPTFAATGYTGVATAGSVTSLAPGQTGTAIFLVSTSTPTTGRNLADFDGAAVGTIGTSTGDAVTITNGTTAKITEIQVQVEAPAGLALGNATSTRVNGQLTRLAPLGSGVEVSIDGTKANFPGVDLTNGTVPTTLQLSIPGCTGAGCSVTANLAKVTQNGNDIGRLLPRLSGGNASLRFHYVVDFTQLTVSQGDRVNLNAKFTFAGIDDNKFAFGPLVVDLANLLIIDLAAPILLLDELDTAVDYRVADGDQVVSTGTVIHTDDLDTLTVTLSSNQEAQNFELAATQRVAPDTNRYRQTIATKTNLGAVYACPSPYDSRSCQDFTVTRTLPGDKNAETETEYALGFNGSLTVSGSAVDTAGNAGTASPALTEIGLPAVLSVGVDNDHADIFPVTPVIGGSVGEYEALAFYIQDDFYGADPVVRVTWDSGSYGDIVEGGCLPNHWNVGNVNVEEVLYNDGSTCGEGRDANAVPPTYTTANDRILVLDGPISPATTNVTFDYFANGGTLGMLGFVDPTTDDVLNEAYNQSGRVIDGRTPNIPQILLGDEVRLDLFANDGSRESVGVSTDDNGTQDTIDDFSIAHTNVADLKIPVSGAIMGTDDLQILSIDPSTGNETQLARIPTVEGQPSLTITHEDIELADCGDDCQVRSHRAFRFIRRVEDIDQFGNPTYRDLPGLPTRFDFLYDTTALEAKGSSLNIGGGSDGVDLVTVDFGGEANNANEIRFFYVSNNEWLGLRSVSTGANGDQIYANHRAINVFNTVDEVTFDIDYQGNSAGSFYGAAYEQTLTPDNGFFIEDLAGNLMAPYYEITKNGQLTEFDY